MAFSVSTYNGHSFGVMNTDIGKQMAKIQLGLKSIHIDWPMVLKCYNCERSLTAISNILTSNNRKQCILMQYLRSIPVQMQVYEPLVYCINYRTI